MKKTVCELFAGVGGFRLGLEKTGEDWDTVWFSQWEPSRKAQWAHDCYVKHWGDIDEYTGIDIANVNKFNIPDHTLLVGGFPCQNYSVAASKSSKGIEGEKGVLWWQIRDTLIAKRPPFVLLENVDRLLKSPASQRGRDFGIMLTCFSQLGYRVEWRIINAAEYGAAQRRRRIFIFAYRKDTKYALSKGENYPIDIIKTEGFFAKTFPVESLGKLNSEKVSVCDVSNIDRNVLFAEGYPDSNVELIDVSNNFKFAFENTGLMIDGTVFTCTTSPIIKESKKMKEIIESDVDEKYYISDEKMEKWEYLKGSKRINRISKNGHEYVFSEGAIEFPDSLDKPSRTMLTSEGSLNRSTHVIEDPMTKKLRLITPVEAERLQGFDDGWTDTGMPENFRYFCMGNALVVSMVTEMGITLGKIIGAED